MLYPRESSSRQIKDLSGIWKFSSNGQSNNSPEYPLSDFIDMPVPASYNDITQDSALRDHIGDVWYEREVEIPEYYRGKRLFLRADAVAAQGTIYIDGKELIHHRGGFLPFTAEAGHLLSPGSKHRLTVKVSNILDWQSLPPGEVKEGKFNWYLDRDVKYPFQETHFDFFNYSGIHRPIGIMILPLNFIEDLTVTTEIENPQKDIGKINWEIDINGLSEKLNIKIKDKAGVIVAEGSGNRGSLQVDKAQFWCCENPYLYQMEVHLNDSEDVYSLPVGIRTVQVSGDQFLLNGKPVYFKGFGKHEDQEIIGRGLDLATMVKDFNLMKWINANSFRTSHYPYSEEMMNMADEQGFLVIDETPAVGFNLWNSSENIFCDKMINQASLENHQREMEALIQRDKNHPSVVLWSVANEASTYREEAEAYFKTLFDLTRKLDPTRPVTIVENTAYSKTRASQFADVICINRYFGWYEDAGRLELLENQVAEDLKGWYDRFQKPIIMTEYGTDTIAGMHSDPPVMFSEEFQVEFIKNYHKAFDKVDYFIGEQLWNFADFQTKEGITRVMGNKKGIFTRNRQPKSIAHVLKKRWASKKAKEDFK